MESKREISRKPLYTLYQHKKTRSTRERQGVDIGGADHVKYFLIVFGLFFLEYGIFSFYDNDDVLQYLNQPARFPLEKSSP